MNDPRLQRHPLGFWQVRDIPSAEELSSYYAERYYQSEKGNYRASYSQKELDWFRVKLQQKHAAVSKLRGQIPGSFLDVGCGEGFAMSFFHSLGWRVSGMDYSSVGIERMNPDMSDFLTAGNVFTSLDQEIASGHRYDLVWLSNVLEHVSDPEALLKSLRRLITPDGVLVVTVPNDGTSLHEHLLKQEQISERFWIAIPDHLAYFDSVSLKTTTEACGWSCERLVADFPIDWFLSHPASNYVQDRSQGPSSHQSRIELDLLIGQHPPDVVNAFYESMASVGMGRQITAYLLPKSEL
jgi:2-polyprenyl-3-methyl-5-hydroxy-6-metoxy-1,4-benzoquinol methylase